MRFWVQNYFPAHTWKHACIVRDGLMKGFFEEKPALPRYTETWDANVALDYLNSLPLSEELNLRHSCRCKRLCKQKPGQAKLFRLCSDPSTPVPLTLSLTVGWNTAALCWGVILNFQLGLKIGDFDLGAPSGDGVSQAHKAKPRGACCTSVMWSELPAAHPCHKKA